jgi:hypothetical protein
MTDDGAVQKGGCLCGGIRYRLIGPCRAIIACHCRQCATTSGNFVAATSVRAKDLVLDEAATLTWYGSSCEAERGFCQRCGGNLFWRRIDSDNVSVMAGTLDPPTRLRIERHIFVNSKSDFYEIGDQVPQYPED